MSLSATPVPAPVLADPLALFLLRCAHRRRAHALSRSLRAAATAKAGGTLRSFGEGGPVLSRDLRLARREQRQTSRLCLARQREAPCEAQRAKQGRDPRSFQPLPRKQAELAHAGRSSGFSAWLKAHNIPRQAAYRLLNKFSKPAPVKGLICTKPDAARPADLGLLPEAARFRLSPFHSALAHCVLLNARDRCLRRDLAAPIVHAFLQFLSGPHLTAAQAWLNGSDPDFPCRRLKRRHPA